MKKDVAIKQEVLNGDCACKPEAAQDIYIDSMDVKMKRGRTLRLTPRTRTQLPSSYKQNNQSALAMQVSSAEAVWSWGRGRKIESGSPEKIHAPKWMSEIKQNVP